MSCFGHRLRRPTSSPNKLGEKNSSVIPEIFYESKFGREAIYLSTQSKEF